MLSFGKKILIILILISLGFMNISCNTMQGAGEDIQSAGEAIEEAAE
jgi:predicted small secreted protein